MGFLGTQSILQENMEFFAFHTFRRSPIGFTKTCTLLYCVQVTLLLSRLTWLVERCRADVVWQRAHVGVRTINDAINDQCDRTATAARRQVKVATMIEVKGNLAEWYPPVWVEGEVVYAEVKAAAILNSTGADRIMQRLRTRYCGRPPVVQPMII